MRQQQALEILQSGANVFITGSAGSGKTYLLNQFISYLRKHQVAAAVTASTGIAATHIGGQTIHSFTGLGVREELSERDLERLKSRAIINRRLNAIKVLIIDEISMLAGSVLANIDLILRHVRAREEAFGGVQLVLCGDFFQLPPVNRSGAALRDIIAFMHPVWLQARLSICYLTEQHRQQESDLLRLLDEMRHGEVSAYSWENLQAKLNADAAPSSAIKLYTHNVDVDGHNRKQLANIERESEFFSGRSSGGQALIDQLKRSVLAPDILELKLGAQVMFVKNNYERDYFNGSLGVVRGFTRDGGWPLVECSDGRKIVAEAVEWIVENEYGERLATYAQVPLRLAWAITVHKSQGMTLDSAELDLSRCFEIGQGYVALSRLRDFADLSLSGFNDKALAMSPLVRRADERLRALSDECLQSWEALSEAERQERIVAAQRAQGALSNTDGASSGKPSTYALTYELVEQGLELAEIATTRELTIGTIIGHLSKLKDQHPDIDLEMYNPGEELVEAVLAVLANHHRHSEPDLYDQHGNLRLGVIHQDLQGRYEYEQIKLALLFVED